MSLRNQCPASIPILNELRGFPTPWTHTDREVGIPDGLLSTEDVCLHLPARAGAEDVDVFLHTQADLIHHLEHREAVSCGAALPVPLLAVTFPEKSVLGRGTGRVQPLRASLPNNQGCHTAGICCTGGRNTLYRLSQQQVISAVHMHEMHGCNQQDSRRPAFHPPPPSP